MVGIDSDFEYLIVPIHLKKIKILISTVCLFLNAACNSGILTNDGQDAIQRSVSNAHIHVSANNKWDYSDDSNYDLLAKRKPCQERVFYEKRSDDHHNVPKYAGYFTSEWIRITKLIRRFSLI